jgi:hypothetical protein
MKESGCKAPHVPSGKEWRTGAVAGVPCKRSGCLVAPRSRQGGRVVRGDQSGRAIDSGTQTSSSLAPEALFCERAPHALRVGMAMVIVVAGKDLLPPQGAPGLRWALGHGGAPSGQP